MKPAAAPPPQTASSPPAHSRRAPATARRGGAAALALAALGAALPALAPTLAAAPLVAMLAAAAPAHAGEVLIATRTLRASTPISNGDVALVDGRVPPGAATDPAQAIGMEARVTLYAGRPIPLASLAPAAMVERNQIVQIVYQHGGLDIRAEGRALGRAGEGESVRVMNLASRSTISGRVSAEGVIMVAP